MRRKRAIAFTPSNHLGLDGQACSRIPCYENRRQGPSASWREALRPAWMCSADLDGHDDDYQCHPYSAHPNSKQHVALSRTSEHELRPLGQRLLVASRPPKKRRAASTSPPACTRRTIRVCSEVRPAKAGGMRMNIREELCPMYCNLPARDLTSGRGAERHARGRKTMRRGSRSPHRHRPASNVGARPPRRCSCPPPPPGLSQLLRPALRRFS